MTAGPVSAAEFAALMDRFGPFERPPRLAVAVSGGADSTALAWLANGWARSRGGDAAAYIVDHGLRPEAAEEAALVAHRLFRLGLQTRILCWQGDKPFSGIQDAARQARHRLLGEAALADGRLHLLLAHHAGDQAETVLMRELRGSGPLGLAGMSAIVARPWGRLLRPLLGIPKARLIATCLAAGLEWVEDPSNSAEKFERVRLRGRLAAGDPAFPAPEALLAGAVEAGRNRQSIEAARARLLAACGHLHAQGWAELEPDALLESGGGAAVDLLAALLGAIGGDAYPPGREAVTLALADLMAGRAATLAGCLLRPFRGGRWLMTREAGRFVLPPLSLAAGQTARWETRFVVTAPAGHAGTVLSVEAARQQSLLSGAWAECAAGSGLEELPADVAATLPVLMEEGGSLFLPFFVPDPHKERFGCRFLPQSPVASTPFAIV
ncbi:tRNA lysidine(34) synthetase TilS [Radicibacter daui]|uniref:tRNA lysidine(34) synthetase TilS n=1 Tax=Radicibacter daui TaxID=3064829 RepID=UPI004046EE8C